MKHPHLVLSYCVLFVHFPWVAFSQEMHLLTTGRNAIDSDSDGKTPSKVVTEPSEMQPPDLVCPGKEVRRPLLFPRCTKNADCEYLGAGTVVCCDQRCIKGVERPKPPEKHQAAFFGIIQRECPKEPLPEFQEIKECDSDKDCGQRICCPETLRNGKNVSYCRTAQPAWDALPAPRNLVEPIRELVSYVQCTPPPPAFLDVFPKTCNTPLDCFPNLCCQEKGRRFCRPPKRSILSLVAGIGQRLIPEDAARKLIQRIS